MQPQTLEPGLEPSFVPAAEVSALDLRPPLAGHLRSLLGQGSQRYAPYLAAGAASGEAGLTRAGGWITLAFAVLAWYHAAGDIIAATFGRKILPVWPLSR